MIVNRGTRPELVTLGVAPPSKRHVRVAFAVIAVIALAFAATAPFATLPLGQIPGFVAVYQGAVFVCELLTGILLLVQCRRLGAPGLCVLGCGYVFNAVMVVAHTASFPGLLAPAGILGGGAQTTAYLYFFWHGAFPLFVSGYAWCRRSVPTGALWSRPVYPIGMALAVTTLLAGVLIAISVRGDHWLLPLMAGDGDTPAKLLVAVPVWLSSLVALVLLLEREPLAELDLWLIVVMCIWIFETALTALLNHARFDLGWYAGRLYGILGGAFVLGVLLTEERSFTRRTTPSR